MPKQSKQAIIAKLMEMGVAHDPQASYDDLLALLKEQAKEETAETPPVDKAEVKDEEVEKEVAKVTAEIRNPFSSFETKLPMTGKAHAMKKKLLSQPRVPVLIPLGHEEELGSTHQVTLNGYTMFIRKGQMVDVPRQVAEVLNAKFKHQEDVRRHPLLAKNMKGNLKEFN